MSITQYHQYQISRRVLELKKLLGVGAVAVVMVCVSAFYSDNPGSIPAGVLAVSSICANWQDKK